MKFDFDVIVIGGGAAGLVAATGTASMGAKTAMIEKNKLGGDCTWYGCVPSKALLSAAHNLHIAKDLLKFGITTSRDTHFDTSGVLSAVREMVKTVSSHHPPEVFEERGIRVIFGSPRFLDNNTVEVEGERVTSKRFILATGTHPLVPPVEGLRDIDYLTNENVFDLEELPATMTVLGGGPIGMELAQAFSRLGVKVTIIEMLDELLFREDEEVSKIITESFKENGIDVRTGHKAVKFLKEGNEV